ncbi:hypothetical protein [Paenibacillus dauci]|uniref:hypothetical protein n=1 Tax=Paenibacillus dauci TaxID=1567106 RepID=UPI000619C638|nr:hypothetical protein [Paenibacillus dauci]
MKISAFRLKNLSVAALALSLCSSLFITGQSSTAFAENIPANLVPGSVQVNSAALSESPQPDDTGLHLDYDMYCAFGSVSSPLIANDIKAEGITQVQFIIFPFPGQNKQGVVFSLEAETEKGWEPVFVSTFQPSSKTQQQTMKLPRSDYKKFRLVLTSTNENYIVMEYKQWTN